MLQLFRKAIRHEGGFQALVSKTRAVLQQDGLDGIIFRIQALRNKPQTTSPSSDIYLYRPEQYNDQVRAEKEAFEFKPLISIVMPVYNVEAKYLELAFQSIRDQWYSNWELCICDDASSDKGTLEALKEIQSDKRVKFVKAPENGGISRASNMALELASGEYVALMDHDDELTHNALFEVVKALQSNRHDFVYSDEDKIESTGHFSDPHFKPDFCEDFFLSTNYLSHLGVIRRELVQKIGGWTEGVEGAQDYDLYLKVAEVASSIHHIPKVLYHWRKVPGSTAVSFDMKSSARESGRISVEQAIARRCIDAYVMHGLQPGTYRVRYEIEGEPLISIVIPFRDKFNLLSVCLNSILANDEYENFEVICVDNNSTQPEIAALRRYFSARDSRIRFVDYSEEFNYSRINNWAVNNHCQAEYVVFMNNDIEVLTTDWLVSLLEHAQREEIGAVGAKLLYPNGTIQHGGILLAPDSSNATINSFQLQDASDVGYFSRPQSLSNYSAVTAALMMVKKQDFDQIKGFDEEKLKIAYNDVDLCLRLMELDKRILYTPFAVAYHYESASRGLPDNSAKLDELGRELQNLREKHPLAFKTVDKHFNPNLAQNRSDFAIHPKVSTDYQRYLETPLKLGVKSVTEFCALEKKDVCIFAHYDDGDSIAPYVVYLLEKIAEHFDIVFVSTAMHLKKSELAKISASCAIAIVRKNTGYDFGSWKTGLDSIDSQLETASSLLIANDSSFGPIYSLTEFLDAYKESSADVYGITDSYEISYHLQSYFILFGKNAIASPSFRNFWQSLGCIEDKSALVLNYEIGLSKVLLSEGLTLGCLAPAKFVGYLNNTHVRWKELMEEYRSPFIKVELLRDNPLGRDLANIQSDLEKVSNYPAELIDLQIKRYGKSLKEYSEGDYSEAINIA